MSQCNTVISHASKYGSYFILIYKSSENVLQQTKVPKYKIRTETIYAKKDICIVLGSSLLSLHRRNDSKSQMKSCLECFKLLFHLVSGY